MDISEKLCAIDFGAWTMKIAALRENKHYEILVNEANFRQTPSIIGYSDSERLMGEPAQIKLKSNFKNSFRSPCRLLGIQQRLHLLNEEMKFSTIDHQVANNQLKFYPKVNGQKIEIDSQQLIIALMTKAKAIIESHSISPSNYFIAIPSYLNNAQRKAIKLCGEAAGYNNVSLIEEWEAIAAEYIFFRQKQWMNEEDPRMVIFIDVGYSKFCAYACLLSKNNAQLMDHETLRYTGSRNMDRLMIEFYEEKFKKQFGEELQKNLKGLTKLIENVEAQRKKLSANSENHMNIECILGDNDLEYNMKREQLENIIMPVFGEFASCIQNLKSRIEPLCKIHSVEIIGGASRTPFFQEITKNIFGFDPSKTLNTSQTIARGASIAGAMRLGLLMLRTVTFKRKLPFGIYCCLHSLSTQERFGKNIGLYDMSLKKPVFGKGAEIPGNHIIKIPIGGPVEIIIFSEENMSNKIFTYARFEGGHDLACLIDMDGILRIRLGSKQKFTEIDTGDILTIERSVHLKNKEEAMKKRDENFAKSYEVRNELQSLLYKVKEHVNGDWKNFASNEEINNFTAIINENEDWLSYLKEPDVNQFYQRMDGLSSISQIIHSRKNNFSKLSGLIRKFKEKYSLYSKVYKGKHEKLMALNEVKEKFDELEAQEISVFWDGTFLNEEVMNKFLEEAENIKK